MTAPRRDGSEEAWNAWIRMNARLDSRKIGLSIQNPDLLVHRYMVTRDRVGTRELQHIMWVEVKAFGAEVPYAQQDTLALVHELLRTPKAGRILHLPGWQTPRRVRAWGVHILRLSGADPGSSDWMLWDGKTITSTDLEDLLLFERDPYSLAPRDERRHHTPSEVAKLQPHLSAKAAGRRVMPREIPHH